MGAPKGMSLKTMKTWVKALRSGKFKQGKSYLKKNEENTPRYCCLGVLAEVCPRKVLIDEDGDSFNWTVDEDEYRNMPPDEYCHKIGLSRNTARVLAVMNDDGKTFKEIADHIEYRYNTLVKLGVS